MIGRSNDIYPLTLVLVALVSVSSLLNILKWISWT